MSKETYTSVGDMDLMHSHRVGDIPPPPTPTHPPTHPPECKKLHLPLARELLARFPAFEDINGTALDGGDIDLKALFDARNELCYPLFEWIRSSNRAHLASIPSALQLKRLGTRHQFVMLSAPPERQARCPFLCRLSPPPPPSLSFPPYLSPSLSANPGSVCRMQV